VFRTGAFAEMLIKHLDEIDNPDALKVEIASLYMNIAGIVCDAIEMEEELEGRLVAAVRKGIEEIIHEFAPDKHVLLNQ
jgi:hypothetical protein